MIDGLILLIELGLMLRLLWTIDSEERRPTNSNLGFFSYRESQPVAKKKSPKQGNFRA